MPLFLWLRFLTAQALQALHRRHLGAQARDAGREISIGGGIPQATSAALAAQLLGHDTRSSEAAIHPRFRASAGYLRRFQSWRQLSLVVHGMVGTEADQLLQVVGAVGCHDLADGDAFTLSHYTLQRKGGPSVEPIVATGTGRSECGGLDRPIEHVMNQRTRAGGSTGQQCLAGPPVLFFLPRSLVPRR